VAHRFPISIGRGVHRQADKSRRHRSGKQERAAQVRIVVHDYAGHPFQLQLSRELARRGHDVLHLYCASNTTGHGAVDRREDDPPSFAVEGIHLGATFEKYSPVARFRDERRYGNLAARRIAAFRPEVVLSSNTPLFAQQRIQRRVRAFGARLVYWQQDVFSVAASSFARDKLSVLAGALRLVLGRVESSLIRRSDHVVIISEDFIPVLRSWGVDDDAVTVIENWAPLDELAAPVSTSGWAATHGLEGRTVLLYTGTLGLKHNPGLILALAQAVSDRGDVSVVVVSEGLGADWLRARTADASALALVVLPYQPYEVLPEVMASADVLVAILEPEAGAFSVPSKVLSYHCAGVPILAAIPHQNLAARIIERAASGVVTDPGDEVAFAAQAMALLDDPGARRRLGQNARRYADATFDIEAIGDRFERILTGGRPASLVPAGSLQPASTLHTNHPEVNP
jgi:glycosyltransferase involved in cell wall biosynthesis